MTHVPAAGAGGSQALYEGVLRISHNHDDGELWPFDGRAVVVMATGLTLEEFLPEDIAPTKP